MSSEKCLCGRDVIIRIDGKQLLQVRKAQIRKLSELHSIRSFFNSEDIGQIRTKIRYKVNLEGVKFLRPFQNCNFADLDNFTLSFEADGRLIILSGCTWEDFIAAADSKSFSEHITVSALHMTTEDDNNDGN